MKLAIIAGTTPNATQAGDVLRTRYGHIDPQEADIIVAVGGDGLMLDVLRSHMHNSKPVYGLNQGTVGFLMNNYKEDKLIERIESAESAIIHPLAMTAQTRDGRIVEAMAINEVSLLRQTRQSAKLKISINDKVRMERLICDGALLATPAGSTAYNLSAHGPILPLDSRMLALTPISAFRPRRWKGALLPQDARLKIEVLSHEHRPVAAVADNQEVRDVISVRAHEDRTHSMTILFDKGQSLGERILAEQFEY